VWQFLNWSDLKRKLAKEGYSELYDKIVQLKFVVVIGIAAHSMVVVSESLPAGVGRRVYNGIRAKTGRGEIVLYQTSDGQAD